jgi:threonine/homoserine/homoserine lactone efflux protein
VTASAFFALAAAILLVALTPGPAMTAIVARGIADGLRPALALSAGVLTGDLLFFTLAAAGMSAIARSAAGFFDVIKVLGALYLIWQGVAQWRWQPRPAVASEAGHERQLRRNFAAGLLLMFGHVQAMLFYAALLPGFVDFSRLTAGDIALVALTLAVVIGAINAGYAILAARARHFFTDDRAQVVLHRVAGTLMLLAALLVATRV